MKKAKTTTAAKAATAPKGAAPSRQKLQQEITHLQTEVKSLKHRHATTGSKKHPAAKKAAAKHSKKRGWSPDESVALCSARAVAESLRIALGVPVSHDDVLALYWLVADDADAGASILETLGAAGARFPESVDLRGHHHPVFARQQAERVVNAVACVAGKPDQPLPQSHALILGLDLPYGEPHAVAVDPDGTWWSWGEPYSPADFPGAVIEEAWAVSWH